MKVLFEEKQRFRQWFLWAILVLVSIATVWPMYLASESMATSVVITVGITLTIFILFGSVTECMLL